MAMVRLWQDNLDHKRGPKSSISKRMIHRQPAYQTIATTNEGAQNFLLQLRLHYTGTLQDTRTDHMVGYFQEISIE